MVGLRQTGTSPSVSEHELNSSVDLSHGVIRSPCTRHCDRGFPRLLPFLSSNPLTAIKTDEIAVEGIQLSALAQHIHLFDPPCLRTIHQLTMKNVLSILFVVSVAFVAVSHVEAMPSFHGYEVPEIDVFAVDPTSVPESPERADRHRRVTCDLLSVSLPIGSLNHAACAANCLSLRRGYRGGRCMDGVCHCRR